jgi:cyclophilin family peptidyl-prolyl cis-trans isomerase
MTTQKDRQRQRAVDARQRAASARKRKEQRKKLAIVVFTSVILVLGVSAFVVTGNGGGPKTTTASSGNTSTVPTTLAPATLTAVPGGAVINGDTPCPKVDGTSARTTSFTKPPPLCITPGKAYAATINTSKGAFTIALDNKAAPVTVNNFVVLARYHYYDGIPFHRIIPGFVIQVGDLTATGSGGPGYKFDDELPKAGSYKIGSVAMANSGANTNGSQFFVITGDAGVQLPPQYSLFGTVTDGMPTVKAIEAVGTPASATDPGGKPTQVVTITSVTIKET